MLPRLYRKDFDLRVHETVRVQPRGKPHRPGLQGEVTRSSAHDTVRDVTSAMNLLPLLLIEVASLSVSVSAGSQNLTCYQCIKDSSEECGSEYLLPCPKVADRCVTHISKHVDKGYQIKRECGLGPCQFEDDMANKGLGMGGCDRSKDEYFCVFCCRTDGCNKSDGPRTTGNVSFFALTLSLLLGVFPTLSRFRNLD